MAKRKKKTGNKGKSKKQSKAKATTSSKKQTKRKVSHAGARKKGLQFEREVANDIGHIYPEAKRNLEYQADSAQEGKDISNTGPYAIQCKNHQNYVPIKTIKEIERTEDNRPVLVTKGNKMEPVVVMYFSDWVKMLEEIRGRELLEEGKGAMASVESMVRGHQKILEDKRGFIEPPKESGGAHLLGTTVEVDETYRETQTGNHLI